MNEERQNERDSQLSAMFDGELPGVECELLARRLTRDEALRAQWSRFSMIGAALRGERGVALHDRVAWRVQSMVTQELTYGDGTVDSAVTATRTAALVPAGSTHVSPGQGWLRFARPVAGASIAAGVAALSIFWLRTQDNSQTLVASNPVPETIVLQHEVTGTTLPLNAALDAGQRVSSGEPDRYVTPAPTSSASIVPPARLANYVVAHSEYSGPLSRRMALLGLVATDPSEAPAATDQQSDQSAAAGAPDAP
ncbi:MAG: sigma-E factor negative regulatory protein [Pseudomonadota bacterium]